MKLKFTFLSILLLAIVQGMWAQTEAGTESALRTAVENGGDVKMTANISLGSALKIQNGKTVTLDLNGFTLSRSMSAYDDQGSVVRVETGGKLTLKDGSGNNSGTITGGRATNGGGITNHGVLDFQGGTITNCAASYCGGGIYNAPGWRGGPVATMTMGGGVVKGNTCEKDGGGIFNYEGCTMTINGGTIEGNLGFVGGGFCNDGVLTINAATITANTSPSCGGIHNAGTMTLNGGSITHNRSTSWGGGGIANHNSLTITGGTITDNVCSEDGGGIWNKGTLNMKGTVTVTNNFSNLGMPDNVFLSNNNPIYVTGSLQGAKIGVTKKDLGAFTSGYGTTNGSIAPKTYFFSDLVGLTLRYISDEGNLSQNDISGNWTDFRSTTDPERDADNAILIKSEADLAWLAYEVNKGGEEHRLRGVNIKLTKDLDLSAHYWVPIGTDNSFGGIFDGQGHIIAGMNVKRSGQKSNGLFGIVGAKPDVRNNTAYALGVVRNLVLVQSSVEGGDDTGGICGLLKGGLVENCVSNATVSGANNVGGIVGSTDYEPYDEYIEYQLWASKMKATIHHNLYTGNKVSATGGNRGLVVGYLCYYSDSHNTFVTHPEMAGSSPNSKSDIHPFPFVVTYNEGATININNNSGMEFKGIRYVSPQGAKVTFTPVNPFNEITNISVNGKTIATSGGTYDILPDGRWIAVTVTLNKSRELAGEGTEASPYLIKSAADWESLAMNVSKGNTFSNKFFRLDADISTSVKVGKGEANHFDGTFDGGGHTLTVNYGTEAAPIEEKYCAPFSYYNGPLIKDLHTAGHIYTKNMHAAGIIGQLYSDINNYYVTTIANCHSNVSIHSSVKGDGTHGGLVAIQRGFNCKVTFIRCIFDGKILGNETNSCGGLLGSSYLQFDYPTVFNECFFAPTEVNVSAENSATFLRCPEGYKIENSYYLKTLGTVQGTPCSDAKPTSALYARYTPYNGKYYYVDVTYDVKKEYVNSGSGVKPEMNIKNAGGVVYKEGEDYTFIITNSQNQRVESETVTENGVYTATLQPTENSTLKGSISFSFKVFGVKNNEIATVDDWNELNHCLSLGGNYEGQTVKLKNDLGVSTMVGDANHHFNGTFDGGGHTLTISYGSEAAPFDEEYCAPFRSIQGATIQNLHVKGDIYTKKQFAGGVVGLIYSNSQTKANVFNKCRSSVAIHSSVNGDGTHGGFVGLMSGGANNESLHFTKCVFDGKLIGPMTNSWGGFLGYGRNALVNFTNSLFAPAEVNVQEEGCATFARSAQTPEYRHTLYLQTMGNAQGNKAYSITGADGVVINGLGEIEDKLDDDVIYYKGGIRFGNTYYSEEDEWVLLTLSHTDRDDMEFVGYMVSAGRIENGYLVMPAENVIVGIKWLSLPGEGTEESPYLVNTVADLNLMSLLANRKNSRTNSAHFRQGANIEFDRSVTNNYTPVKEFHGSYDGGGFAISGLNINLDNNENVGLFGRLESGTVKNVIICNSSFTGWTAAPIAGTALDASLVENCHVMGDVTVESTHYGAGGVVAYVNSAQSSINRCSSQATVKGDSYAGGIAAMVSGGVATNCIYLGSGVTSTDNKSNAVVGSFSKGSTGKMENCYYTAPTLSDENAKLMPMDLEDNSNFMSLLRARDEFVVGKSQLTDVGYSLTMNGRTFKATQQADGTWKSRAYTVCVPFEVDLEEILGPDYLSKVTPYTLNAVKDNKEFIFISDDDLKPGKPFLLVVKEGEVTLKANNVLIDKGEGKAIDVRKWGDEDVIVGQWRGTYRKFSNAEAAEMLAYALQSVGDFRRIRTSMPNSWWGEFRSMFCAKEFTGNNRYLVTYERQGVGGDGDDEEGLVPFEADEFEGDAVINDEDGIHSVIRTIDGDDSTRYFDLQGRQLNNKPNRGVYIENGKKYLRKRK